VDAGHTVLLIEHHLDATKTADYVIGHTHRIGTW
jgi:excinuclease UvrABC ATPase subunit